MIIEIDLDESSPRYHNIINNIIDIVAEEARDTIYESMVVTPRVMLQHGIDLESEARKLVEDSLRRSTEFKDLFFESFQQQVRDVVIDDFYPEEYAPFSEAMRGMGRAIVASLNKDNVEHLKQSLNKQEKMRLEKAEASRVQQLEDEANQLGYKLVPKQQRGE